MKNTKMLTFAAMLSAVSAALMFLETPLPFLPPFLQLDASNVPLLIGAFIMGPLPAILMTAVKDTVHLLASQTGGVGELADFLITLGLILPASIIYKYNKTKKGALLGCAAGILSMTIIGIVSNLFIILPFYSKIMPLDEILNICAKINPAITGLSAYILYGVLPFNIIKGLLICAFTMLIYKKISTFIHRTVC